MEKRNEERFYTTLDAYRAGFLKLRGHSPSLLVEQKNKIVFAFPLTDTLLDDLRDYENGVLVDAFKYSLAVKSIKTQIYAMREAI